MGATIREIVDDALTVVGEVAGAGVQTFGEDRMFADAVRAFNLLFKKTYWDQFTSWMTVTLDGVNGKITTNAFVNVKDYEDIASVHKSGQQCALSKLPKKLNPSTITGTSPRFWTSLPSTDADLFTKRILIYPKASIGLLDVRARLYPKAYNVAWDWGDVMDLDKDMLVHGVSYLALASDETNTTSAENQRLMMEARYKDIQASLSDSETPISSGGSSIPDQWFVTN